MSAPLTAEQVEEILRGCEDRSLRIITRETISSLAAELLALRKKVE